VTDVGIGLLLLAGCFCCCCGGRCSFVDVAVFLLSSAEGPCRGHPTLAATLHKLQAATTSLVVAQHNHYSFATPVRTPLLQSLDWRDGELQHPVGADLQGAAAAYRPILAVCKGWSARVCK
jgi:hypothetical protein